MIIKTALNGHAGKLYAHLTRVDDGNERIRLVDIRGCVADDDLKGALREMKATAAGSVCSKSFYHVSFAATAGDQAHMTDDAWLKCADAVEREFNLQGHARAVVQHFKDNRWHQHVVWNRIDPDTGRAAHLAHERRRAIKVARELEKELKLEIVSSDRPQHRKEQRPPLEWEKESARRTKVDAGDVRDKIAQTWSLTRNGAEFAGALDAAGLILARGDTRPFVVLDGAGNFFALGARLLPGEKSRSISAKLADVAHQLPTLAEAKALLLAREHVKRMKRGGGDKTGLPGSVGDAIAERYRAEHVRLKKKQDDELKELDKERRAELKRHPDALNAFDAAKPRLGLLARITGRARRQLLAWEKKHAAFVRSQARALKAFEKRKAEIERAIRQEGNQLRAAEKQEKGLRAKFERQARKAERELRQELKQQQAKPKRTPAGLRRRQKPEPA